MSLPPSLDVFEALTSFDDRYSGMPDDVVPTTRVVPRRDAMFVVVGEVDLLRLDARIAWSPGLEYDSRRPSPTGSRG